MTAEPRTYPHGVPCWVDTEQPSPDGALVFYGELFGWRFVDALPPDATGSYFIAGVDGQDVAAIGPGDATGATPTWNTYIAVDDAGAAAELVERAGGRVVSPPTPAGPGGVSAVCLDPLGAPFRLWEAHRRLGAQLVNAPGAWNFSDLHTPDPDEAFAFYHRVFGWVSADIPGAGTTLQVPGYGAHLAATSDPGIYERQAGAPAGFADVIGSLVATEGSASSWQVTFSVADRDASAETASRLGATVQATAEGMWSRTAHLRDPQGAELVISQFTPPDSFQPEETT